MKTSSWARLLQVARNFAGKVHLKVDMEKLVSGVTLQSVIAASEVMDDALTRMKARITELSEQLRLKTAVNPDNARQELNELLDVTYLFENNCVKSFRKIIDAECPSIKNNHFGG